jgi:hypothetical protein
MQELLIRFGAGEARVASPAWVRAANSGDHVSGAHDHDTLMREVIGDGDVAFTTKSATAWMRALLDETLSAGPCADMIAPAPLRRGAAAPYGAGLFIERYGSSRLLHHAGHFDGWTALIALNLERKSGVFALCDLAPGNTRAIRSIGAHALEAFAPGSTLSSLTPIKDEDPALTRRLLSEVLRPEGEADLTRFSASMQPWPGTRGAPNFWAGAAPASVDLVSIDDEPGRAMRRYRLTYGDRTEHISVGVADGLIDWTWCL